MGAQSSQVQGRATRRAAGVNGPAPPVQRGRESPLSIIAAREAHAAPPHETSAVIKAVVDTDHTDHPNVKPSSSTVDDVLRAQGGTAPPPKTK